MTETAEATTGKRRARKRADGEGSIRFSETKKLWIGRVMVGYRPDGKADIREVAAKQQGECERSSASLRLGPPMAHSPTLPRGARLSRRSLRRGWTASRARWSRAR